MLHSLYRIADLCVVPSIYEPFGLVALEAMASGCPCIVADTGGLREVVPNEDVGLRFRSRDPRSLAQMMERVLADPALRDRLVDRGLAPTCALRLGRRRPPDRRGLRRAERPRRQAPPGDAGAHAVGRSPSGIGGANSIIEGRE